MSKLFSPLTIGNIEFKNRIVMSPMCQYSATDGFANYWHFVHYSTRAIGGCAAIIQEATAVSPEGRITYGDMGIWQDEHIDNLRKITSFIGQHGSVPGIQLAHAGRKASCNLPSTGGKQLTSGPNSWVTVAPSAIPFNDDEKAPIELPAEKIRTIIRHFEEAAIRATKAGYKIIEIHAAHGYLIHQFLSPISNKRTDEYGGSFDNRIRFLIQIIDRVKNILKPDQSLWVRISATDWTDGGWNIDESVKLAHLLKEKGVDVTDVSSGGNVPHANIPVEPGYQVPFAERIKKETGVITGAVGIITKAQQAENILYEGRSDIVLLGRELLRNPYFPLQAAKEFGDIITLPLQYKRAF
jgi:2,4-dienoyl-CoA reductase-like NADH-dependent reductase (Old Yellow Enzyme family)